MNIDCKSVLYFNFFIGLVYLGSSCNSNSGFSEKPLTIKSPKEEKIYTLDSTSFVELDVFFTKEFRVHIYINGNCNNCIGTLEQWSEFLDSNKVNEKVDFIFYVYAFDYENFRRTNESIIQFNYPLVFDRENMFLIGNNNKEYDLKNRQVCTNKNNEVIWYGNFIENIPEFLLF